MGMGMRVLVFLSLVQMAVLVPSLGPSTTLDVVESTTTLVLQESSKPEHETSSVMPTKTSTTETIPTQHSTETSTDLTVAEQQTSGKTEPPLAGSTFAPVAAQTIGTKDEETMTAGVRNEDRLRDMLGSKFQTGLLLVVCLPQPTLQPGSRRPSVGPHRLASIMLALLTSATSFSWCSQTTLACVAVIAFMVIQWRRVRGFRSYRFVQGSDIESIELPVINSSDQEDDDDDTHHSMYMR
ncbi:uncharacterized protein MONBRDRAFT_38922 [Monosiga brevicollis MX1]|uniref:Uncharacterized protein n=1 Tax=Monosiga brevicollis TaxID=81824 RepID=A9VB01_MONBE|nr:uncharacterized protein MONBRDRAFT_38922 [Monosiga brevicollis MX1]EDQ85253.1 predicted protein [Monosiga brevicollis MX1]|eukprot:XP_001749874.1 hypothetical protein [Monosiga brevicollis MX1]